MSPHEPVESSETPSLAKQKKRKILLTLLAVICLIAALSYATYYFLVLRNYQETDDAYVAGNQVQIIPQVTGNVSKVWFDNTDKVNKGDILVSLDKTDAKQAVDKAKTQLANSVRQTRQLMINSQQYQANIEQRKIALSQAQADLNRRIPLGKSNLIGREELQHARDAVTTASAALEAAQQQYNANQALLLNTDLQNQPAVQSSAAELRNAWLALQRTDIRSPITGYVSRRNVQVGAMVSTSSPLMVVVPPDQIWVDANFKETQLARMRIGQPATVIADIYGDDIVYQGKVVGLDMGTGSAFSLLPAQNATGNWIKVVQRLPVRIALDPQQIKDHPLRIGLSTLVSVDTKNSQGDILAKTTRQQPAYSSDVLQLSLQPVDALISKIIQSNAE